MPAGDLDLSFNSGTGAADVFSVALQGNGSVLIGGRFSQVDNVSREQVARLRSDGSLDLGLDPGAGSGGVPPVTETVRVLALQADGKIVVGGDFTFFGGQPHRYIVRLNADGSVDPAFTTGTGFNGDVTAITVLSTGLIMVSGWFTEYNGVPRRHLARLNPDGSLDASFDPGPGPTGSAGAGNRVMYSIVEITGGQLVVGGWFEEYAGVSRRRVARLNADGTLDPSFDPGMGADDIVYSLIRLPNDKFLIAGGFTQFDGIDRRNVARIEADGSLDAAFETDLWPTQSRVLALAVQTDGKIVIGGGFRHIAHGNTDYVLGRLLSDGTTDSTFDRVTNAGGSVLVLALQPDGKIVVGGSFGTIHGTARRGIARVLGNSGSAATGTAPTTTTGTAPTTTPALTLWRNAVPIGGGWKWLAWFGLIYDAHYPWVYHQQHGYLYSTSAQTDDIYFYQPAMGWCWTAQRVYPLIYRYRDRTWLGYVHGTTNPRWFYNYSLGALEFIN